MPLTTPVAARLSRSSAASMECELVEPYWWSTLIACVARTPSMPCATAVSKAGNGCEDDDDDDDDGEDDDEEEGEKEEEQVDVEELVNADGRNRYLSRLACKSPEGRSSIALTAIREKTSVQNDTSTRGIRTSR